ncbi:MAG TPA: ABC transporter substrate-binding protein [Mycobacteriales bacterium]|nr:ABC transporter substrate-binding protein [Mycobacteriales bacterium]
MALAVAGCGSTAAPRAQDSVLGPGGLVTAPDGTVVTPEGAVVEGGAAAEGDLGVPAAAAGSSSTSGSTGSGGSSGGGSTGGSSGASTGGSTGGSAGSGGSTVAGGPHGPGVTATTIKVGILSYEDPNAGNNAAGITTADVHELDKMYAALIDDLNKRGGMAGRKVQLVVHKVDSGSGTFDQIQQGVCEKFARDDPVFATWSPLGDNAIACFERAGITSIGSGHGGYGLKQYARYPHLITPGAFSQEHQMLNTANGLHAQGWLGGWSHVTGAPAEGTPPHVGIVTFDLPDARNAAENYSKPAFARAGVKQMQVFYIRPNLQDGQADAAAAVLKFKSEGVTHVTFLDNTGGILATVFAANANSQGYFPRYGCDSGSCNQIVAEQMPQSSLRGAVLVGWSPLNDVPASKDHVLPARARCEKIMTDHDMAPYSRNDQNVMANVCDSVWFLEAALNAAGPRLTNDTAIAGAIRIGRSFTSPATFAVEVTPRKHAGADAYRYAEWDPTCGNSGAGCFIYTGPVRRFGS